MTKAESIAYLKKKQQQEEMTADGVLPATRRDVDDEMGRMDTFREFKKDEEKRLTSDEG